MPESDSSPERQGHQVPSRGQVRAGKERKDDQVTPPQSSLIAGRFGRMFRNLPSFEPSDESIKKYVDHLLRSPEGSTLDNDRTPAGFTYLGQFIDHDLTFDPVSSLDRQNDPDALQSFRTPRLDLDSVYGAGPKAQPYLYQKDKAKLLVGQGVGDEVDEDKEDDLPRNGDNEVALTGDPRNDENILVGQLQLAFIKLHNRLVDDIRAALNGKSDPESLEPHHKALLDSLWDKSDGGVFREAQRMTRWHYQWVVLKEFLPKICGDETVAALLEEEDRGDAGIYRRVKDLEFYKPRESPYIPVEWSVAAYRYGHSQIRPFYDLNAKTKQANPDIEIFIENPDDQPLQHLAGGRKLPEFWTLDWSFFFNENPPDTEPTSQKGQKINTRLAGGLRFIAGDGEEDAATRTNRFLGDLNLKRGRSMGLPSGQAVARLMGYAPVEQEDFEDGETPLWFYVLKEAEVKARGEHLGPVGGRIVAEVILGILKADPFCFLRVEPAWSPVLPRAVAASQEDWGISDLLRYAVPNDGRRFSEAPGDGGGGPW